MNGGANPSFNLAEAYRFGVVLFSHPMNGERGALSASVKLIDESRLIEAKVPSGAVLRKGCAVLRLTEFGDEVAEECPQRLRAVYAAAGPLAVNDVVLHWVAETDQRDLYVAGNLDHFLYRALKPSHSALAVLIHQAIDEDERAGKIFDMVTGDNPAVGQRGDPRDIMAERYLSPHAARVNPALKKGLQL